MGIISFVNKCLRRKKREPEPSIVDELIHQQSAKFGPDMLFGHTSQADVNEIRQRVLEHIYSGHPYF